MAGSYCEYVANLDGNNIHKIYHDFHYGYPIEDDGQLFERFVLEINQAGLSWDTMLKKQEAFRRAFKNFDIEKVAGFTEKDVERLKSDAGIIRNKLKINAAIYDAGVILQIQKESGSFRKWLDDHHPMTLENWVKLFRSRFKFVGPEIVKELLMSTGYLPGAHIKSCPVYQKISKLNPPFLAR